MKRITKGVVKETKKILENTENKNTAQKSVEYNEGSSRRRVYSPKDLLFFLKRRFFFKPVPTGTEAGS